MAEAVNTETKMVNNAIPRVMFDTNTYRHIIDGDADSANTAETYQQIRQMIIDGKIEAFLSESLFTLEAIPKKDRLSFMTKYQPKISVKEECQKSFTKTDYTLAPSDKHKVDFYETGPLKDYYDRAIILGFKIVRFPRAGWITNAEIDEDSLYNIQYYTRKEEAFEASAMIEERGCGMQFVYELLAPYDNQTTDPLYKFDLLFKDVNTLPINERKKRIEETAKAFAEMSDGDSIASSIGLGCCAFCTNDSAKNAGAKSVMSESNVEWLKEEYGFNKLTPTELLEFLLNN